MLKDVSIVIPCFNCESFVHNAIDSALKQDLDNYEIILVNNNSNDNTRSLLDNYSQNFPNIIRVFEEPEPGAPFARNLGLKMATGNWIQFLDADDRILPSKISKQLSIVNKGYDLCFGSSKFFSEQGKYLFSKQPNVEDVWLSLIKSELGNTVANLWKKDILDHIGGWNIEMTSSQEYDLLFRYLQVTQRFAVDYSYNTYIFKQKFSISQTTNSARQTSISMNAINVRLSIKDYLSQKSILERKHCQAIDIYIYASMLRLYDNTSTRLSLSQHLKSIKLSSKIVAYKSYIAWFTLKHSNTNRFIYMVLYIWNFIFQLPKLFLNS